MPEHSSSPECLNTHIYILYISGKYITAVLYLRAFFYPLFKLKKTRARILKHSMEAEKSTFRGELSFQGQSVQQGLHWLQLFVLLRKTFVKTVQKTLKLDQKWSTFAFCFENIHRLIWKPCTHTFSPTVISKCLRIRAPGNVWILYCILVILRNFSLFTGIEN
jgi:hypothetical protein